MCIHCKGNDYTVDDNDIRHTVCMCAAFDKDIPIEHCNPYCCEYESKESEED